MDYITLFSEGMFISRNFEERSLTDTEKLYETIKVAVALAQDPSQGIKHKKAIDFLAKLFQPFIKKWSSKVYQNLKGIIDYADVLQETYALFFTLLAKYNPAVSQFSYYIKVMLPQHLNRWAEKEIVYNNINISVNLRDYDVIDPNLGTSELVEDYLIAFVLTSEYIDFITQRAERQSRSSTVKEVCHKYFLGKSTCSEIARELGISYHAVYEIIGKIKVELMVFFCDSAFSGIILSSTGLMEKEHLHW